MSKRDMRLTLARLARSAIKGNGEVEGGEVKVGGIHHNASYAPEENSQYFTVQVGERWFAVSVEEIAE